MYKSEVYGEGGIYAKVVADSTANGVRLTTLELNYHRFIHSEFMTHRMFSRNASSSRAIPVARTIEQVESSPAMPIHWGKNQSGMQAKEECTNLVRANLYEREWSRIQKLPPTEAWKDIADFTSTVASDFAEAGYHKQIVNRILEPFQFIKVVVTATEWDNFFNLRLHKDAQPEIMELARCMWGAIYQSEPQELNPDNDWDWHLPYVTETSIEIGQAIKASVARCARVSYMNHDNTNPIIEKDIALHDQLLEAGHMSPFEHVATPMQHATLDKYFLNQSHREPKGITHMSMEDGYPEYTLWSGNFRGFLQYRQLVQ